MNAAVAQILREMLPESTGYLGLVSPSKEWLRSADRGAAGGPRLVPPLPCVALQLGRKIHRSESIDPHSVQARKRRRLHLRPPRSPTGFLGMIHVQSNAAISAKRAESIGLFAAQVTLGLTNLRMREALRSQSVRDSLTGLFNRRYFDETLQREIAAYRREGAPLAVLMLDLDHFKRVNDSSATPPATMPCAHSAASCVLFPGERRDLPLRGRGVRGHPLELRPDRRLRQGRKLPPRRGTG